MINYQLIKTKIQRNAKCELQNAFTLLELLLVIAIISVLAGIIVFALKPADTLQKANSAKVLSDQGSLEKALNSYMVDSGGSLPTVFNTLSNGFYDICKQGQSGSCVSLDELITSGKLASIPVDTNNQTATNTGFKVKYNPVKTELSIYTTSEYRQWAQSSGITLSDGLMGYWKMDEASWNGTAGEVKDSSGSVNHGTASGGATTVVTNYARGGTFDGVNDYVQINDNSVLKPVNTISVSAWFNTSNKTITQRIISKTESSGYQISLNENSACAPNTLCFLINIAGFYKYASYPVTNLNNNTWYLVTGTYDGSVIKLYLNNNLIGSTIASGIITQGPYALCIGNEASVTCNAGNYFVGSIDEVRIYNRALNETEVKALYELAPGPIAYWKFDALTGSTQAEDSSGNGYAGTLVNGPVWTTGKFNNGLQFDGVDDYIPITINVPETNYTYSTWFKTSDSNGVILAVVNPVSIGAGSHDRQFGISNSGKFCHRVWAEETYCSSLVYNDNKWHYAAVTVGSGGGKLYVDGVQVASGAKTASDFTSELGMVIGNHYYGSWGAYNGLIDDLKIYNYVRTPAQILWEYNQGI